MARTSPFQQEHPLEKRQAEALRIREKYPDRIPVIVEKAERSDIQDIDKKKYLVPADLTVASFVYVIRRRIKLSPEKAIFIFANNVLPPTAALMSSIYAEHKVRVAARPGQCCAWGVLWARLCLFGARRTTTASSTSPTVVKIPLGCSGASRDGLAMLG